MDAASRSLGMVLPPKVVSKVKSECSLDGSLERGRAATPGCRVRLRQRVDGAAVEESAGDLVGVEVAGSGGAQVCTTDRALASSVGPGENPDDAALHARFGAPVGGPDPPMRTLGTVANAAAAAALDFGVCMSATRSSTC
jgi:hypothetical protein